MKWFRKKYLLFVIAAANSLFTKQVMADNNVISNIDMANLAVDTLVVQGYRINLLGEALSASEGVIGSDEIASRPVLRTGEILEFIPGMVVTQHSGSGKANQYFLRGFNLDHGSDFNTSIDGMPVNMRTHAHGQGYTDLNFIMPDFIQTINYRKGPYYAEVGDFSGAGAALFTIKNHISDNFFSAVQGENNFSQFMAGGNINVDNGDLLLGIEHQTFDGPWSTINEDVNKNNFLSRYSSLLAGGDLSITVMAYQNRWNSADQIPTRAVSEQLIDNFGSLDTQLGGHSNRYSLSSTWTNQQWAANIYSIHSSLDLFSNFTYFLDDPVNGDQFEQVDERNLWGAGISRQGSEYIAEKVLEYKIGSDFRYDNIGKIALYHTHDRKRLSTTRDDSVYESSLGLFAQSTLAVTKNFHVDLGARYDIYSAQVNSNIIQNSGNATQGKISFKWGASYQITNHIEIYTNAGQGLHSNDARGVTITQDPVTGTPSKPVELLVPSTGAEIGMKLFDAEHFNISTSLWYLRSASELVFAGDAGNTEASRASERYGNEIAAYYWLDSHWNMDTELAWTRASFTQDVSAEGKYIEGSIPFVANVGLSYEAASGWHGALRYRYFGARRLDSFDEHHAHASSALNMGVGYQWQSCSLTLDILNMLNSRAHDIDYFYRSRLANESADGREDVHYHPLEPRSLRIKGDYKF